MSLNKEKTLMLGRIEGRRRRGRQRMRWLDGITDSMEFFRRECWSGLPCPPPRDLPDARTEPRSPALEVGSLPSEPPEKPSETRLDAEVLKVREDILV